MGDAAKKVPSFAELCSEIERLPEGVTGEILTPGALRTMSRPGAAHRLVHRRVGDSLRGVDRVVGGTGWWIEVEAEVAFGERLLVPDLAGWRVERTPERPQENPITATPDWCCEVLSPNTARVDRAEKLPLYIALGVAHVWLVDPALRLVEVYCAMQGRPALLATASEEEGVALAPFDLPMDVRGWWEQAAG